MRLSISNIAWDVPEDAAVAALLRRHGIDAIDIAPGKYFRLPEEPSPEAISQVRRWWADRGIEIVGMQALLFGAAGLNLFGAPEARREMLARLATICRIAAALKAPRLTFGSPKNRDRTGLTDEQAMDSATGFFRELGRIAEDNGVIVCIEPNPPCYGCNFVTRTSEAVALVQRIGHPAIRVQLDTGALVLSEEDAARLLREHAGVIGHIHASEPNLVPLGDAGTDHRRFADLISGHLPAHLVTVEMVATAKEPHAQAVERALRFAAGCYRNEHATVA